MLILKLQPVSLCVLVQPLDTLCSVHLALLASPTANSKVELVVSPYDWASAVVLAEELLRLQFGIARMHGDLSTPSVLGYGVRLTDYGVVLMTNDGVYRAPVFGCHHPQAAKVMSW